MPYEVLVPASLAEFGEVGTKSKRESLEDIFCDRRKRSRQCAGLPDWMRGLLLRKQVKHRDRWGAEFVADAVASSGRENFVFELKYGAKYEPVALAEVLHHAAALDRVSPELKQWTVKPAVPVIPVIVAQWNAWIRGALDWLLHARTATRLRLLEVIALRDPRESDTLLWFDEPLARSHSSLRACPGWVPAKVAAELEVLRKRQKWRWYARSGGNVLLASTPLGELDPREDRVMLSQFAGDKCLLWRGNDRVDGERPDAPYLSFTPTGGRYPTLPWR